MSLKHADLSLAEFPWRDLETLPADTLATLASSPKLSQTWAPSDGGALVPRASAEDPAALSAEDHAMLSCSFGCSVFSGVRGAEPLEGRSRFDVQQALGAGTYGEVWRARDLDLSRAVALKRFKGDPSAALSACRDELRFVGRLEHPGVPPVYQAGLTEEGQPYVVMKLLEGEPLSALIARLKGGDLLTHASFPFSRRLELILQLLRVVGAAHTARVLHRDIKPDNIYVGRFGDVSLIDWGIAEDFDVARAQPRLCGTPVYLSPEQGLGRPLGPESDIYSVGAVAYELLSLESAAPQAKSVLELLRVLPSHEPMHLNHRYSPHQGTPPVQYSQPVMRALARDPAQRFSSAEEMSMALQRALDGYCAVSCPRTLAKRSLYQVSRWIDSGRYLQITVFYVSCLLVVYGLMRLGGALGL